MDKNKKTLEEKLKAHFERHWSTWLCVIYAGFVLDGTIPCNWFTFPLGLIAVGILVRRFLNW